MRPNYYEKERPLLMFTQIRYCIVLLCFSVLTGCSSSLPDGLPDDAGTGGVCSICHGNSINAAPPVSTAGTDSVSDVTVGAHQSHLMNGTIRSAVPCASCHVVPSLVDQSGHIDESPAEISWSLLASADGLSPDWNRTTATCSSVYCHGASLSGGTNTTPVWTVVDNTQAACGTCHGNPPPPPHSTETLCRNCHSKTVSSDGTINTAGNYHIDGTVQSSENPHDTGWDDPVLHGYAFYDDPNDCKSCHGSDLNGGDSGLSCDDCHTDTSAAWRTDCTFCHGGLDNTTGAPPYGVRNETAISNAAVGLHTTHTMESASHIAWECSTCHIKPVTFNDSGHIDGSPDAEVTFSSIAGGSAVYNTSTSTCSTLYCHGDGDSNSTSLSWTALSPQGCDSCHGYYSSPSRLSGEHKKHLEEGYLCSKCHLTVINNSNTIVNKSLHINGIKNILPDSGSYNISTQSCSTNDCHGSESWYDN